MSFKTEGSNDPILDRFLSNPAEVFPQKSFAGRLFTWVTGISEVSKALDPSETDDKIRTLALEVEFSHRKIDPSQQMGSLIKNIDSCDIEDYQKEALYKLVTKLSMRSLYTSLHEKDLDEKNTDEIAWDRFIDIFFQGNAKILFTDFTRDSWCFEYLSHLYKEIGLEKLLRAAQDAAPFMQETSDTGTRLLIIQRISQIDPLDRAKLGDALSAAFSNNLSLERLRAPYIFRARDTIIAFDTIIEVGATAYIQAAQDAAPFIQDISEVNIRAQIIKAVSKIDPTTRKQLSNALSAVFPHDFSWASNPSALFKALNMVNKVGPTAYIQAAQDAAPFIQDASKVDYLLYLNIVDCIISIPEENRSKIIEEILAASTLVNDQICMLFAAPLIPLGIIKEAFSHLKENSYSIDSLYQWLVETEESREALYNYLSETLDAAAVSSRFAGYSLSNKIIYNYLALGLNEEHPLFQKAVAIKIMADPESIKNPKNPYNIYNSLLQKIALVDIPVPSVDIDGLLCSLDVQGLQAGRRKLTFGDLPEIDKQFFEKTFTTLEARVSNDGITKAKTNTLKGTLIPYLLKTSGKPHENAPQSLLQLYTVIAYLSTLSTEIKNGQQLSEQEDELLAFANYIRECKTGQEDGLAGYYNLILKWGFSNQQAFVGSSHEAVKRFAEPVVSSSFRKGCCG